MDVRELLIEPTIGVEICRKLSFGDAIQLYYVINPNSQKRKEWTLPCTIQEFDDEGDLLTFQRINPNTIRAYNYIKNRSSGAALLQASIDGDFEIVQSLLEIGVNVNFADQYGHTPLIYSILGGNRENIVRILLEHGANPDVVTSRKASALLSAVEKGYSEIIRLLFEYKADPNIVGPNRITPLISAIQNKNVEIAKILLENGANPNSVNHWQQPALLLATINKQTEIVKLLLEHQADVNAVDVYGETALMETAKFGQYDIAELLLQHGANVNITDQWGNTAISLAERSRYYNMVDWFKSFQ